MCCLLQAFSLRHYHVVPPSHPKELLSPLKIGLSFISEALILKGLIILQKLKDLKKKEKINIKKQLPLQTSLVIILSKNLTWKNVSHWWNPNWLYQGSHTYLYYSGTEFFRKT